MWFRKKKEAVSVPEPASPVKPQILVVESKNMDKATNEFLVQVKLRRGMWVQTGVNGVGIVSDAHPDVPSVAVMLVDEKGENKALLVCDPFSLRQASLNEIPEPRRPHPDNGRVKGYL